VDATSIEGEIRSAGAKRVVAKYYDTTTWEHVIMAGIRRADSVWIKVAEELQKGSDGGASEDLDGALLDGALYDALPVSPFTVLLSSRECLAEPRKTFAQ
jgi:hypothetical protein